MKPNLLFVFADQMRASDMGCAGNTDVRTPNLDHFASEALRLSHCCATSPVCGPNRGVLLTGTYPTTNRVLGNDLPLPTERATLGTIASAEGYDTGYIGKWHLDGLPRTKFTPPGPRRQGFDYWAVYNCAHDYFHPRYFRDTADLIEQEGYEPEVQTDLALEFLERVQGEQSAQRPFCLLLSWGPPHDPYDQVPDVYRALYDPYGLTLRPNVFPDAENPLARGKNCRQTTADYYAAITALDGQFSRLLAKLDELQLTDNTIVIFTSDHGDMLWSHGWMKKQTPYDEAVRVPFLIRWPGRIAPGRISDLLLGTVDLLPTLSGLLGWHSLCEMDGKDLSPAVVGQPDASPPESVFIANHLIVDEAAVQGISEWRGVRTHRHTYAETPGRIPWLMFDNVTDPYQQQNLIGDLGSQGVEVHLRGLLTGWLDKTNDPFLTSPKMLDAFGLTAAWHERERQMHGGH